MAEHRDDPFKLDELRAALARSGQLTALKASYAEGAYPELEDMSSARLWDERAACAEVRDFRIRRLQAVADRVPAGGSVLDMGIGWGEIIPMIRSRKGCRYTGIYFSPQIVERAARQHPDCRFVAGGLDQTSETFDVALALEVLEHILPSRVFRFLEPVRGGWRMTGC